MSQGLSNLCQATQHGFWIAQTGLASSTSLRTLGVQSWQAGEGERRRHQPARSLETQVGCVWEVEMQKQAGLIPGRHRGRWRLQAGALEGTGHSEQGKRRPGCSAQPRASLFTWNAGITIQHCIWRVWDQMWFGLGELFWIWECLHRLYRFNISNLKIQSTLDFNMMTRNVLV